MTTHDKASMRFIVLDVDQEPCRDADGTIVSEGHIGRVDAHNLFLRGPACPDSDIPTDLNVGGSVYATFRSCGTTGTYKIWRVE